MERETGAVLLDVVLPPRELRFLRTDEGLVAAARERGATESRTWADVARETRAIYAEVAR